jgi:putative transposase
MAGGRRLKLLNVVDEYTRESLPTVAGRHINADATVETLERIVLERDGAPNWLRCDNGPELTANALRDWCRSSGTGSSYIEPGAPGRIRSSSRSTGGCAMNCWPSSSSRRCSRSRC